MGRPAGLMTEYKTEAGRPIYISDNGDIVSEQSVTIKMGNKFVNVPSIQDGIQYSEDELVELIKDKKIQPTSTHKTELLAIKAAEKRSPSLMSQETAMQVEDAYREEMVKRKAQTEMNDLIPSPRMKNDNEEPITFAEGGLLDEGGTVDPVSGNEVPAGSTQEEVRDDIPAQLSEGEFVFPADVVRYIGLENLMKLRQKAKSGLKLMEDMGQMGNAEEAVAEDDLEYIAEIDMMIDDFDPEEEETRNFAVGGYNPPKIPNFSGTTYKSPTASDIVFGGSSGVSPFGGVQSPVQYTSEEYIGPNGERITVTLINGKPVNPPPPGYKKYDPTKAAKAAPTIAQPKVAQPTVADTGGDGGDGPQAPTSNMGTLGMTGLAEAVGILAEVNPDLEEAFKNKPKGLRDLVVKGLIPSLISSIQYGRQEAKAIKALEQGYGLTNFDVDSTYGKWRAGLDNPYMAAAVLESEKQARDIVSGESDWRKSDFGSREEAKAVANSGWASEEHFKSIQDEFDEIDSAPSQQAIDDYNRAEIERAIEEGRQANLADSRDDNSGDSSRDRSDTNEDYGGGSGDATQSDDASFGGVEGGWD